MVCVFGGFWYFVDDVHRAKIPYFPNRLGGF